MFRRWNNRELNYEDRFFRKAVFFIFFLLTRKNT